MLGQKISNYFSNPTDDLAEQYNHLSNFQSGGFSNFSTLSSSSDWKTMFGVDPPEVSQISNSSAQPDFNRFSSLNFNTYDLPSNDVLFPNSSKSPTYSVEPISSELDSPAESASPEATTAEIATEAASSTIPSLAVGVAASTLLDSFNNVNNSNNKIQAEQGNGPNGHAFDAVQHAEQQNNLNSDFSNFRTAAITTGSAFGPEGLAAGLGAAAISGIVQNFTSLGTADQNTTMSTGGNLVNAAVAN